MRKYGKPSTYTIAMCQGKFWTLNVLRKTLILDGYHVAMMFFLIMQELLMKQIWGKKHYEMHRSIGLKYWGRNHLISAPDNPGGKGMCH